MSGICIHFASSFYSLRVYSKLNRAIEIEERKLKLRMKYNYRITGLIDIVELDIAS